MTFQVSYDYSFAKGKVWDLQFVHRLHKPLGLHNERRKTVSSLRQKQAMSADTRVPVTVLTGYLGADTARP